MERLSRTSATILATCVATACAESSALEVPLLATPEAETLFLAQPTRPFAVMDALYQGTVVRDEEGCLRLGSAIGPERHTVVWPYGAKLVQRGDRLVVVDEHGADIGTVGERFRFGGGVVAELWDGIVTAEMRAAAEARCPGRFWIVGDVL